MVCDALSIHPSPSVVRLTPTAAGDAEPILHEELVRIETAWARAVRYSGLRRACRRADDDHLVRVWQRAASQPFRFPTAVMLVYAGGSLDAQCWSLMRELCLLAALELAGEPSPQYSCAEDSLTSSSAPRSVTERRGGAKLHDPDRTQRRRRYGNASRRSRRSARRGTLSESDSVGAAPSSVSNAPTPSVAAEAAAPAMEPAVEAPPRARANHTAREAEASDMAMALVAEDSADRAPLERRLARWRVQRYPSYGKDRPPSERISRGGAATRDGAPLAAALNRRAVAAPSKQVPRRFANDDDFALPPAAPLPPMSVIRPTTLDTPPTGDDFVRCVSRSRTRAVDNAESRAPRRLERTSPSSSTRAPVPTAAPRRVTEAARTQKSGLVREIYHI